ncbi:MAG TPA: SurA N-terminal domain-containing protein [Ideonella sp.]|uniref:SurA N-terminal domain-containing protein n=1 Tax=Ideonella sp. TaxID=1929293 RepID=UPI002C7527CD|nr:SurA N-terminal domain-containing protein [Ideonella sp.]HSI46884.1 SurA N-terminal domain-containing protein [Ideonella sp.]
MFDFVRSHNRLLQGLLVLLIFPSFVFFGLQGYSSFTSDAAATVAKVDGRAIKQSELDAAHRQQIEQMRERMPNIDVKLFDTPEMKRQTLDELVRERVMETAVAKQNLGVSDLRLQQLFVADPQFAMLRKPDGSLNKEFLAAQGMTATQFQERVRQQYAQRQVLAGVNESAFSGKALLSANVNALLDQREVQLQRFEAGAYLDKVKPTDAEIEAFYKAHGSQFHSPEVAKIDYVVLDLAQLQKQVQVNEEDLKTYYEQNKALRYTAPEERRASHILIAAAKDAPAAERAKAKEKAEALLAELSKQPERFAELAKKNSADPGSAEKGGDLDFFGRGAMTKPFEDAAFAMKKDELSKVVESDYGFHIIKLTDVRGGQVKPFDSVRAEILDEVGKQAAQKNYAAAAEEFSNTVEDQSDSLQPVVDKLKLTKLSASVQRQPVPNAAGPLASAKLLDAVFGNEVLKNKRNTQAIETGPNQMVAARVTEYQPEHLRPLAEVHADVLKQLRAEQAAAAARKEGEARVAALKQNPAEALPQVVTVSRAKAQDLPRQVVDAALAADLSKAPAVVGVDLGAQGYAVLKVLKSVPRIAGDADVASAQPAVARALASAETAAYYDALKRRYKVDIKLKAPEPAASATEAN